MKDNSQTPRSTPSSKPESIEVITAVQRRRRWAPAEKMSIVQETYKPCSAVT